MAFFQMKLSRLAGAIVVVAAMVGGGGCAPPEPLEPDCTTCSDDAGCGAPGDAVEDLSDSVVDGDLKPDIDNEIDAVLDPDVGEIADGGDPPDLLACTGEPDCPQEGICKGMAAHCVKGAWVCDFGALAGFEMGGETSCDGEDNDCDGAIDESLPIPDECSTKGVCAAATIECVGGKWDCGTAGLEGYEAGAEITHDDLDNDCDGATDEELTKVCEPDERQCAGELSYQLCAATQTAWESAIDCGAGTACMGAGECTVDGEFRVNAVAADTQTAPAVTSVSGRPVVVWHSNNQDGSNLGIYYRAYDASGGDLLPESQANLFTTGAQQQPVVAALGGDSFLVGWESNGQDGSGLGVYGRLLSLSGGASAEIVLADVATGSQQDLALAPLSGGGAGAVWADAAGGGKVFGATVGSQGWLLNDDEELVAPGNLPMANLACAELPGGSFAVVYEKKNGFEWNLEGRVVEGVAGGSWNVLSTLDLPADAEAIETQPKIAVSGGNVFLAWLQEDAQEISACVQVYDGNFANPSGLDCLQPEATGVVALELDELGDGTAVLVVQDGGSPNHVVKYARVGANGKLGGFSEVDSAEMDLGGAVSVAGLGGGKALVAWSRTSVADGLDIWARFVQVD
jgi:hypothetical protein